MDLVRYTEDGPLVVAHRGGAGLRPENTLAAFARSLSLGVLWLESDVRASADGVAVLHHDRTLARLFGLEVAVADLTWDQLRGLRTRDGDRLVRPVDLLGTFPQARFAVDVKEAAALPGLLADVRRTRSAARVCLAGAPDRLLAAAASAEPGLTTALGWRSLVALVGSARLGLPVRARARVPSHARWAHVPDRLRGTGVLTAGVVARAAGLGLGVMAWTVDDPGRAWDLLDLGVRGIITDRPDVVRDVVLARAGGLAASAGPAGVPVAT